MLKLMYLYLHRNVKEGLGAWFLLTFMSGRPFLTVILMYPDV